MEIALADSSASQLHCTSCGYDLRGLSVSGNCPECGKSIALSFAGDLIGFGNEKWRRRLTIGAMLLTAALVITALLHGLVVYQLINSPGWVYWPLYLTPQVQELLSIIVDVLAVVGIWWLTFPDPLQSAYGRSFSFPAALRILVAGNFLSGVAFRLIGDLISLRLRINWGLATLAPQAIQIFLLYELLRRFSRRLPNQKLARRFGMIRWLMPLAFIAGRGGELLPYVMGGSGSGFHPLFPVPGYALSAALHLWAAWLLIVFTRGVCRCQTQAGSAPAMKTSNHSDMQ